MPRIKIIVAYDGTDFSGWQLQPGDRTVQGALERAISGIVKQPTRVHGSGRTDSGVHAVGQVAHFDVPEKYADIPWQKALNPNLPLDMRVLDAEPVADDFHSRYSAISKTYSYTLWLEPLRLLPQRRHYVWPVHSLDIPAMEQAALHMLGEHDFSAFQNTGTLIKTTVRTVQAIWHEPGLHAEEMVWKFTATGFLRQMVRNMMGCIVFAGRGKFDPQEVPALLKNRDRSLAPPTAPPQGLSLERVEYSPSHCRETA